MRQGGYSLRERFRYKVDSALLRGTGQVVLWLALTTMVLVLIFAVVIGATGISDGHADGGFGERTWVTLTRALDPGTMADDTGWTFRLSSLLVTLSGVLVFSALIGLITSAIEMKVHQLRRGRSPVVVSDHTLVLGSSAKLAPLVAELAIANENHVGGTVVVMAPHDAVDMDEALRAAVPDRRGTKVQCRSGDPRRGEDLAIVNPAGARSVVILSPDGDHPDSSVMKTCLAVLRAAASSSCPVIVEVRQERHARSLEAATPERVKPVVATEVSAEIVARCCRHPGLTAVFEELLDFAGDEIYFDEQPSLVGETFATALLSFDSSTPIGLEHDGEVLMCPPMSTRIVAGDRIIAISEDDDTLVVDAVRRLEIEELEPVSIDRRSEQVLILGWSELGPRMLAALDPYVGPGSSVHVVYDPASSGQETVVAPDSLRHLSVTSEWADTADEATLRQQLEGRPYDRVVVLCYRESWEVGDADAVALVTFLLVRSLLDDLELHRRPSVLVEVLEDASSELVELRDLEDMVVSERLTALLITQLSENARLAEVFASMFDPNGVEITARPLGLYAVPSEISTFADLVAAVARAGDICIGFQEAAPASQLRINPSKDQVVRTDEGTLALILLARRPVVQPTLIDATSTVR